MENIKINLVGVIIGSGLILSSLSVDAQSLSESWKVRKIRDKEVVKEETAYRNKINFFFGNYWNSSHNKLKKLRIAVKNYKASGKKSKALKLRNSDTFLKYANLDLKERAYIAHEYGLFSIDYVGLKGIENLTPKEEIFINTSIYRSLSGPIANKVGYKSLLQTTDGQEKLKEMLSKIISDHEVKNSGNSELKAPKLSKDLRKQLDINNKSNHQIITSFCSAAVSTFDKFAAKNKEMRELMGGESWGKSKREENELVNMSCADKRVVVYKMIAQVSR